MVSIHRPLGYGPSTLPLRHSALPQTCCPHLAQPCLRCPEPNPQQWGTCLPALQAPTTCSPHSSPGPPPCPQITLPRDAAAPPHRQRPAPACAALPRRAGLLRLPVAAQPSLLPDRCRTLPTAGLRPDRHTGKAVCPSPEAQGKPVVGAEGDMLRPACFCLCLLLPWPVYTPRHTACRHTR